MEINRFSANSLEMEYLNLGSGTAPMLAFHGFGRTGIDFSVFKRSILQDFQVLAFNLFEHGESRFPTFRGEWNPLQKKELKAYFTKLLDEKGWDKVSLLGYSLGGKIAFCLMELMPERIDKVMLFAPDGIRMNQWYWIGSHSWIGRQLLRGVVYFPQPFLGIMNLGVALGLVRIKLRQFILQQLSSKEKRKRVVRVWSIFRKIDPDLKKVVQHILLHNIDFELFLGRHDTVIKASFQQQLLKLGLPGECITILESGHHLMTHQTDKFLAKRKV